MERARAAGAVGADRHARLVVLPRPRLGQPAHPGADLTVREALRFAPEALTAPRWLAEFVRAGHIPDLTVPNMAEPGQAAADVLRRVRRVDAVAAAELGGRRLAAASSGTARSCSRASRGSTTPGAPSTPASPRSRCPTTAATTSTAHRPRSASLPSIADGRRRPDRGAARRRHPPRQRRRQGAGTRRAGGHDRPRLPVGPRRQRPGRRGERARHPAAASTRRCSGSAAPRSPSSAPTTSSSARLHPHLGAIDLVPPT